MAQEKIPLVIRKESNGFSVYAATYPTTSYLVSGVPEKPTCSCGDVRYSSDPTFRCEHVKAVLASLSNGNGKGDSVSLEGRPEMTLKRSVSPDGRIDSLSVEFSVPLEGMTQGEVKTIAEKCLGLQSAIALGFLGKKPESQGTAKPSANGTTPARITGIGGAMTRSGYSLFLAFEAQGKRLSLFGGTKKLGDALVQAGYPGESHDIRKGVQFDLPCRIVTKPSEDGKYLDIVKVLPPETN